MHLQEVEHHRRWVTSNGLDIRGRIYISAQVCVTSLGSQQDLLFSETKPILLIFLADCTCRGSMHSLVGYRSTRCSM
jgi:hypothetical protein